MALCFQWLQHRFVHHPSATIFSSAPMISGGVSKIMKLLETSVFYALTYRRDPAIAWRMDPSKINMALLPGLFATLTSPTTNFGDAW
jgi:hypothetical protein